MDNHNNVQDEYLQGQATPDNLVEAVDALDIRSNTMEDYHQEIKAADNLAKLVVILMDMAVPFLKGQSD